jgi:hypothetical protein
VGLAIISNTGLESLQPRHQQWKWELFALTGFTLKNLIFSLYLAPERQLSTDLSKNMPHRIEQLLL